MSIIGILGLTTLSLGLSLWTIGRHAHPVWRFVIPATPPKNDPLFEVVFDYRIDHGQAHSPAIIDDQGALALLWFEGSAEAQADVDLYAVSLDGSGQDWQVGSKQARITRHWLGQAMEPQQLVVTLGNTIDAGRAGEVFSTVVSIGGWAMASVATVTLGPDGPVSGGKLNLSPFLNRSNLVKAPVIEFEDGHRGLPAYFELGPTYGVLARVDQQGRVRDTVRLAGPGKPIQPMIVPLDAMNAVAFLRDFEPSGDLLISHSSNGGQTWTPAVPAGLPNPSAPVAALMLDEDTILVAANDDPGGDDRLSLLAFAPSDGSWRRLHEIEPNGAGARYPAMYVHQDGNILLTYSTGNKTGLRVCCFSRSWAEASAL